MVQRISSTHTHMPKTNALNQAIYFYLAGYEVFDK